MKHFNEVNDGFMKLTVAYMHAAYTCLKEVIASLTHILGIYPRSLDVRYKTVEIHSTFSIDYSSAASQ